MNPYALLGHIDALTARIAKLRGRPLVDGATPPSWQEVPSHGAELLTGRLVRELRMAVANIFFVLKSYGMDCDDHRLSALSTALDEHAAEHLYPLRAAARGLAEIVERRERDTGR